MLAVSIDMHILLAHRLCKIVAVAVSLWKSSHRSSVRPEELRRTKALSQILQRGITIPKLSVAIVVK